MRDRERDILMAATELFSRYGYHSVGVDKIIANSNVAKMTFYKYFPSKEVLIQRVLMNRDQQVRADIMSVVNRARTPLGKLRSIFDWYEGWFLAEDFYGCMFIKASEEFSRLDSEVIGVSKAHKSWLTELLESILNEIGAKKPKKLAGHIVNVLDGLTVNSNLYGSGEGCSNIRDAWQYIRVLTAIKDSKAS